MLQFAKHTGQIWKYRVWQVASVAAVAISVAFFSLWSGNPARLPEGLTTALYFPLVIFWFAWWAVAIRCPACREPPAWHQMRHGHASDEATRLFSITVCPACGFNPTGSRRPAAQNTPDATGVD